MKEIQELKNRSAKGPVLDELNYLPEPIAKMLKRQHYALFGHSAVKTCHYTKKELVKGEGCYKKKFYGIQSHRCLQMTPSVSYCEQKCVYCWRPLTEFDHFGSEKTDSAKKVAVKSIEMQRKLLSGFGAQASKIGITKLAEAKNPKHVAISLSGEPTLYPYISELIKEYKEQGMSVFLVSNGLHPEILETMEMPTQLYISVDAVNKDMHRKIDRPQIKDAWERIMLTLKLLPKLKTRKVIRLTCIKGMNMSHEKEFGDLFRSAEPDFVELKGYSYVGYSRTRLNAENSPNHNEVREFAGKINNHLRYVLESEHLPSRAVLLGNGKTSRLIDFSTTN